jgi:uncharacterized membrane protein
MIKETLIFMYELLYFILISLPLAITLYLITIVIDKFKRNVRIKTDNNT